MTSFRLLIGCCNILENVLREVSNRYPRFLSTLVISGFICSVNYNQSSNFVDLHSKKNIPLISVNVEEKAEQDKENKENKKNKNNQNNKKISDLNTIFEDEIEDDNEREIKNEENDNITENIDVKYSTHEEQFLAELFYKNPSLDYKTLFNYLSKDKQPTFELIVDYTSNSDTKSDMISTQEAEETFKEIQYANALGKPYDVDSEKARKFDFWIKFNPDLFGFFESRYALSRNVNYNPFS